MNIILALYNQNDGYEIKTVKIEFFIFEYAKICTFAPVYVEKFDCLQPRKKMLKQPFHATIKILTLFF